MKKTATKTQETKVFTERITKNNNFINELTEKLGLKFTTFEDYKKVYQETKEESKLIENDINKLKYENEVLTLASNYKADAIRNNLYVGTLKALKELKLLDKNLTELRKEKIKQYLINEGYADPKNFISIYKDSSDYINCRVLDHNVCYNEGVEIFFNPSRIEYIEKMEMKCIELDSYYEEIAKKFIDETNKLKEEIKEFNKNIASKLEELENKNKEYYSTKYIYNNAGINLYK